MTAHVVLDLHLKPIDGLILLDRPFRKRAVALLEPFQRLPDYLLGKPAPKWLTDGVPFIAKETMKEPK